MSFYGGRTGQSFYISKIFSSYQEMNNYLQIRNIGDFINQFVLLYYTDETVFNKEKAQTKLTLFANDKITLWIRYDNEFKYCGKIGAFHPEILNNNWMIGDKILGRATPQHLFIRIPRNDDGSLIDELQYAYGEKDQKVTDSSLEWVTLAKLEGLTDLTLLAEQARETANEIKEIEESIDTMKNEVIYHSELAKSYAVGNGNFKDLTINSEQQGFIKEREESQEIDNASSYYEATKELYGLADGLYTMLNATLENNVPDDYWEKQVQEATGEALSLNTRLNKFLYQFDTHKQLSSCTYLKAGDTCTVFGADYIGDSNSLLFRIYKNDETLSEQLKADGLTQDEEDPNVWIIHLPGGKKQFSEAIKMMNEDYIAYSIAVFSGVGTGGTGGGSSGSLTINYTSTAAKINEVITIPFVWRGTVSGRGKLYVTDNNSPYITGQEVMEGAASFTWTPSKNGKHILNIYVEDRMGQATSIGTLTIEVGELELAVKTTVSRYAFGSSFKLWIQANTIYSDDPIELTGSLSDGKQLYPIIYTNKGTGIQRNIYLQLENYCNVAALPVGSYVLKLQAKSQTLTSNEITFSFSVYQEGQISISINTAQVEYSNDKVIEIPYTIYLKNASTFTVNYYLRGGDINSNELTYNVKNDGKYYKKINSLASANNNTEIDCVINYGPSEQPYELMIEAIHNGIGAEIGYLINPFVFTIVKGEESAIKLTTAGLQYCFDARLGQQNTDTSREQWLNIANNYVENEEDANIDAGTTPIALQGRWNYHVNGWNPTIAVDASTTESYTGLHFTDNTWASLADTSAFFPDPSNLEINALQSNQSGVTIDLYLKTYDIGLPNNAVFYTTYSDSPGIVVTTNTATMYASGSDKVGLSVTFNVNEPVHLTFVYEPIGATSYLIKETKQKVSVGLMKIYLNGICCGAKTFETADISNISPFRLNNGPGAEDYSKCDYYAFRIYKKALTADEIIMNYIYDYDIEDGITPLKEIKNNLYEKNFGTTPYMPEVHFYTGTTGMVGMSKDDGVPMRVEFLPDPTNPSSKKVWDATDVFWQGTSSIAYPVKNYKMKIKNFELDSNGNKIEEPISKDNLTGYKRKKAKYVLYDKGKAESTFTLKADYMDSSHCHNTGNANFVNDTGLLNNYSLTPAQARDLNKDLIDSFYFNISDNTYRPYRASDFPETYSTLQIRNSIYGRPCRLFIHQDVFDEKENRFMDTYTFGGIYNFNHDKGNTDTFGLYRHDDDQLIFPACTSFEISANSNSTSGAFKNQHLVKFISPVVVDNVSYSYGYTNYNTRYDLNLRIVDGKPKPIPVYQQEYLSNNNLDCHVLLCDEHGVPYNKKAYIKWINLEVINNLTEEQTKNYEDTIFDDYYTDFELRFPDEDDYEDRPFQFKSEYTKLRKLIDWVDKSYVGTAPENFTDNEKIKYNFKEQFTKHFDLDTTLNYFLFVMVTGLIDNFGKNLMVNTWGVNNQGKVPYIKSQEYYHLRKINANMKSYDFGYSTLIADEEGKIKIVDRPAANGSVLDTILISDIAASLDSWEYIIDEEDIVWYPHPYDLDSCLGSDNSGYLRYGVDIEMFPSTKNGNGYNDFYDTKFYSKDTPFNTATSNLWVKFQQAFANELALRYEELRRNNIFSISTFTKYYYTQQIGQASQKDYNDDVVAKYLANKAADVVEDGVATTIFPANYIVVNRGDDWHRLKAWITNRLSYLDSLYDYNVKNSMLDIRAGVSDKYEISLTTHQPYYVQVVWTNTKKDSNNQDVVKEIQIITDADGVTNISAEDYYLVQTINLDNSTTYGITKRKEFYSWNGSAYVKDDQGSYLKIYEATNVAPYWKLDKDGNKIELGYKNRNIWYFNIVDEGQRAIQQYKVSSYFSDTAGNSTLEDIKSVFSREGGSGGDQEIQVFGAFTLKEIDGLSSLQPTKLILSAATRLLNLKCSSSSLSILEMASNVFLRTIDLSGCSILKQGVSIRAMDNLRSIDLSETEVTSISPSVVGSALRTVRCGPLFTELNIKNQYLLNTVTLQAHKETSNVLMATRDFGLIEKIILENCPYVHFEFEIIYKDLNENIKIYKIPASNTLFQEYVYGNEEKNLLPHGIFSMFKNLQTLTLKNSYRYQRAYNPQGLQDLYLSIPIGEAMTVPSTEKDEMDMSVSLEVTQQYYKKLNALRVENTTIKKISIVTSDEFQSVVFPGRQLTGQEEFFIDDNVQEIEMLGSGTVFMPCINDWSKFNGLKSITINTNIDNKEKCYYNTDADQIDINALALILPTRNLRALNFNQEEEKDILFTSIQTVNDFVKNTSVATQGSRYMDNKFQVNLNDFVANKGGIKINFSGLKRIKNIYGFNNINIGSNVLQDNYYITTFRNYFYNCNNLEKLYHTSGQPYSLTDKWLTYEIDSLENMFYQCKKFDINLINQFLTNRLSNSNAKITTMKNMFNGCTQITTLVVNFENMQALTTMAGLFEGCSNLLDLKLHFTQIKSLQSTANLLKDTPKLSNLQLKIQDEFENDGLKLVENMNYMFYNTGLTLINMESWHFPSVKTMKYFCANCQNLINIIPPSNSNEYMLADQNTNNAYTFGQLKDLSYAFANCPKLQGLFMVQNPENYLTIWKFNKHTELTEEGKQIDVGTNLSYLFSNTYSLKNLQHLFNWDMENVDNISYMFYIDNSTKLKDIKQYLTINMSNWDLSFITNANGLFYNRKDINSIIGPSSANFKMKALKTAKYMFSNLTQLDKLDVSFIISELEEIESIFNGLSNGENNLELTGYESWNIEKVTNLSYVFANTKISDIDISSWDTDNVNNFSYMFYGSNVKTIEGLSSLITSNNTAKAPIQIGYLFAKTSNLNKETLQQFAQLNFEKITSFEHLFEGCKFPLQGEIFFNSSQLFNMQDSNKYKTITNIGYMFKNCTNVTIELPIMSISRAAYVFAVDGSLPASAKTIQSIDLSKVDFTSAIGSNINNLFANVPSSLTMITLKSKSIASHLDLSYLSTNNFLSAMYNLIDPALTISDNSPSPPKLTVSKAMYEALLNNNTLTQITEYFTSIAKNNKVWNIAKSTQR